MGLRRTRVESRGMQASYDAGSQGVFLMSVEAVTNWAVTNSQWPVTAGLARCTIEMMSFGTPRFDVTCFGIEVLHISPRRTDLMIVPGRVSYRMASVVHGIYDKMTDPKWVVSMGVCVSSGGMFSSYAIVQGRDHTVLVDVYLPGYLPRPKMLINAVPELRKYIKRNRRLTGGAREVVARAAEKVAPAAPDIHVMKGLLV